MSILDPRLWLALLATLGLAAGGAYLKGRSNGKAVERAAAQKDIQAWNENADAAYSLYLEAREEADRVPHHH